MTDDAAHLRKELRWKYFTSVNSLLLIAIIFVVATIVTGSPFAPIVVAVFISFMYADTKAQSEIKQLNPPGA